MEDKEPRHTWSSACMPMKPKAEFSNRPSDTYMMPSGDDGEVSMSSCFSDSALDPGDDLLVVEKADTGDSGMVRLHSPEKLSMFREELQERSTVEKTSNAYVTRDYRRYDVNQMTTNQDGPVADTPDEIRR